MSNQLQITGGAKVRNLEGVLTGTSGVVSSLGINVPSGIPQLDGSGKILVSQLPNSVMEYKGTWDASTNTPTLVDGTGNAGDVYLCNVAGTVNFGAGPITFYVGDQVLYSGTVWQRSSGASGTVTSVAVTESGDALTITGSPITTSGTINIGFAGTGSQYIKGDGTLATFPTIISEAQNLVTEVYNSTGATIAKGSVVYINGGQGNLPTITKAQADTEVASNQTIGLVRADITNMNNGYVTVAGRLENIDTQAYSVGTTLYLSPSVAGGYTSTKPTSPDHIVYVGVIVRSHPTQGVIEVKIQNTQELNESADVLISSPANNEGLFYESSTSLWKNKTIANVLGYTPANDALVVHLAGTETITGVKTFDAGLSLKDAVYPTPLSGYSSIGANSFGISIVTNQSSTIYRSDLGFPAAQRTYTFPNLDGTLALLEGTQTFTGSKTFGGAVSFNFAGSSPIVNYGLALVKGNTPPVTSGAWSNIYASSGNNNLTIADTNNTSVLQFQAASSYTYTFPASSGTLALSSDLSSYVPYTGATTNVNLGSYDLTGNYINGKQLTVNKNGTTGGALFIESGSAGFGFGGTSGIAIASGSTNNLTLAFTDATATNTKAAILNFGSLTNNTNRTYTLPDISGTLALLEGSQTFTGSKTFSATVNNDDGLKIKLGSAANLTAGYLTMSAYGETTPLPDRTILRIGTAATQLTLFKLQNTGSYTYDFPAANGYIATWSSATTNRLAKFGTNNLVDSLIWDNGTNVGIGNTNTTYTFDVTGTGRFTGALNGTSATFSSIVTATADSNAAAFIALARSADDLSQIKFNNNANSNTNAIISVNKVGSNGGEFSISTKPDGSPLSTRLTIASTGAATFSSSVTANSASIRTSGALNMYTTDNSNYSYIQNSGATSGANNLGFYVSGASPDLFIKANGYVGIGTSSPNAKLSLGTGGGTKFLLYDGGFTGSGGNGYFAGFAIDSPNANDTTLLAHYQGALVFGRYTNANDTSAITERMRITSGGYIVMGATSSDHRLRVIDTSAGNGVGIFSADNASYNSIKIYGASADGYNGAATVSIFGRNTSTNRSINAGGTINASGTDYAEYMTKAIEDNIAKGDIVGIDDNGLLTNIFVDAKSFVVKSTNPSYVGGDTWGSVDDIGKLPEDATEQDKLDYEAKLEAARAKVDRIAFSGQVPCNVLGANVGDYIIPINDNGKITGQAVTNPTFEQYQISVGKVWKIMEDGRAWIAVKIG